MCSTNNTTTTTGNHGGDYGGAGAGDSSPTMASSKKIDPPQKRKRVPKRGPGVAELEKILREQENNINITTTTSDNIINIHNNLQGHFSPFVPSNGVVVVDHYLQQPHHHQSYFTFPRNTNNNISNNNKDNSNYCFAHNNNNNMVGVFSPEMKINYSSIGEGFLSSMTNNFSPLPPNISSSVGLLHCPIEPPSSQSSLSNYNSIGPHDQKIFGAKRPISAENNHFQASSLTSNKKQRPEKSTSSLMSHGVGIFDSNNLICKPMPREAKWDVPRECDAFNSPNAVAPVMMPFQAVQHQFPNKFDLIPFQMNMKGNMRECLNQRSITGPDPNKPFFSFFPSTDPRVTNVAMFDLNKIEKGNKSGQDGIDLNLKLSTS